MRPPLRVPVTVPLVPMVAERIRSCCTLWMNDENVSGIAALWREVENAGASKVTEASIPTMRKTVRRRDGGCGAAGGVSGCGPGFAGLEKCKSLSCRHRVGCPWPCSSINGGHPPEPLAWTRTRLLAGFGRVIAVSAPLPAPWRRGATDMAYALRVTSNPSTKRAAIPSMQAQFPTS